MNSMIFYPIRPRVSGFYPDPSFLLTMFSIYKYCRDCTFRDNRVNMDDAKPPPHVQEVTNQLESRPDESSSLFHDVKSENDHLCWKCRAMFSSIIPTGIECSQETPREGEHPNRTLETTDNLDTTAQRGCPLCQRLMQAMGPPMVQLLRRLAGDELRHSYKIRRKNDNVLNLHLMIRRMYDTEDLSDGHYWIVANLELYQELGTLRYCPSHRIIPNSLNLHRAKGNHEPISSRRPHKLQSNTNTHFGVDSRMQYYARSVHGNKKGNKFPTVSNH